MFNGTIKRYKARLVAKGFNQIEGINHLETFSLVVKMTTILLLLSLAATNKWYLLQLDINRNFLHGGLDKEIYMKIRIGLKVSSNNIVCKLNHSIYDLK